MFRYIDDVLSLNNSRFGDFVDRIYPIELEIKDTTDTDRSASYLDLHLEIDSEGRLRTKLYNKRDDFNFPIVNFPFICSNIPAAPAYGVYISQLIRYSKACGSYQDFQRTKYVFTSKDHCNVYQLFIVTSIQLLLPVIQTIVCRCRDFQSAEEKKSAKIKCPLFSQKPQKLSLYGIYSLRWYDIPELVVPMMISLIEGCC